MTITFSLYAVIGAFALIGLAYVAYAWVLGLLMDAYDQGK